MTTATRTLRQTATRTAPAIGRASDAPVRRLRELHARAGALIADADWTPAVERAVHDLAAETRRTIAEAAAARSFVPSPPGSETPPVVRFRELGTLQRRLVEVLRGPVDPEAIREATVRTSALVGGFAGTLA